MESYALDMSELHLGLLHHLLISPYPHVSNPLKMPKGCKKFLHHFLSKPSSPCSSLLSRTLYDFQYTTLYTSRSTLSSCTAHIALSFTTNPMYSRIVQIK
ncbi:4fe-4s iron-sulfur binding protein, partial [Moniliophthora roreri]